MKILGPGRFLNEDQLRERGLRVGSNVMVHETAILIDLDNIVLGSNVRIDPFCLISGKITLGNHVHVAAHVCMFGEVTMLDFSGVSHGARLYAKTDDFSGATLTGPTVSGVATVQKPIELGRHVIVGSGSVVLPGVTIGEGSVVGALSLVPKSLAPWGIYGGNPVRLLKPRKRDLLAMEAKLLNRSSNPE